MLLLFYIPHFFLLWKLCVVLYQQIVYLWRQQMILKAIIFNGWRKELLNLSSILDTKCKTNCLKKILWILICKSNALVYCKYWTHSNHSCTCWLSNAGKMAFAFNKFWQFGIIFTLLKRKPKWEQGEPIIKMLWSEDAWNGQLVSRARPGRKLKFSSNYVVCFWYIEKECFRKLKNN